MFSPIKVVITLLHNIMHSEFMEYCYQSWNFTNFAPKLYQICTFFATTKTCIDVESLHFPTILAKHSKCKIKKNDDHGKLSNGHGKVMEKVFENTEEGSI